MECADRLQVLEQPVAGCVWKHRHPVAAALGPANRDVAEVEVDVLDPEPEALENPHARAVEEQNDESRGAFEARRVPPPLLRG